MAKLRVNKIAAVGVSTETTGSVFFDGVSDTLGIVENGNDFDFDADFSIEFWVYFNELKSYQDIAGTSTNSVYLGSNKSGWVASYYTTGTDKFRFSFQDDSSWIFQHAFNFAASTNTWYHVAYQRHDGSIKLYVNGDQIGSTYSTSTNLISTENRLLVGSGHGVSPGSTAHLHGYVSNLRICKGHAVYKSNFTLPTKELDVHPQSVLLACYDGENIFADKTGRHIIAAYGDRLSSPTPTATDSPIGITTFQPGLDRDVDNTSGPTFQGGVGYNSQNWLTLPKGTTTDRNRTGGRGLFAGGENPSKQNVIYSINISSSGIAGNFGDLTIARKELGGCASSTRGVFAGGSSTGESPAPPFSRSNVIDYVTLATEGNAADFGDLTGNHDMMHCGLSNITRGIFAGGEMPSAPSGTNTIQYVTIAALGAAQDFGDLLRNTKESAGCASPTRGIIFGDGLGEIQYITISTLGNAIDFGDQTFTNDLAASCSDSTRGMIGGGTSLITGGTINTIQYVTITTLGNAQDFGDLTHARSELSAVSNSIRGVFAGGSSEGNRIDYITIQTTGNAQDFGDLPTSGNSQEQGSCSDSHGGIS